MKYVIADNRIPKKALASLKDLGFSPILLPCSPSLAEPVSAHPDMLIFFGDKIYFPHDYYKAAGTELELIASVKKSELAPCDIKLRSSYPDDIAFNALQLRETLLCKEKSLCPDIADYAKKSGIRLLNIAQGYARCATCKVSDTALITADPSVKKAAYALGIDVLFISEGGVLLPGYGHGFIGGASGTDGENVYFCGSLSLHPDGKIISDFCKKHKKEAVSLSDEPLYDVGTMFFI